MTKSYQYAIQLLTKRDYSRYKLRQKMHTQGYGTQEIEETIDILISRNFLREDYYIEARIRGLLRKNYGTHYIQQKLQEEEIYSTHEQINHIAQEIGLSAEEQIRTLLLKKTRLLPNNQLDYHKKCKLMQYVQRKGHSIDLVQQVLSSLF